MRTVIGTGTITGNLLGFAITIIAAIIWIFSFNVSLAVYLLASYFVLAFYSYANTIEPNKDEFISQLSEYEKEILHKYHLYISGYFGPAQATSALLNHLRVTGLIWGIGSFIHSLYLPGILSFVYFFLSSGLIKRLDPNIYTASKAKLGDIGAAKEMAAIATIIKKLESTIERKRCANEKMNNQHPSHF